MVDSKVVLPLLSLFAFLSGGLYLLAREAIHRGNRRKSRNNSIPVTVFSGLLGSGKTTLISQFLRTAKNNNFGIIVNDFAEVNVDSRLLKGVDSSVPVASFAELSSGCVCCSSRGDIGSAMAKLLRANPKLDHVIIECSGLANPRNIAAYFSDAPAGIFTLARLVTVVDAGTVLAWLQAANGEAPPVPLSEGAQQVSALSVEQVESADVIVLNKVDRVSPADVARCHSAIGALNPGAKIQTSKFGVLGSGSSLLPEEKENKTLPGPHPHPHAHARPGEAPGVTPGLAVSSFVYRRDAPFHPEKLQKLIRVARGELRSGFRVEGSGEGGFLGGVLRSKGLVWVASCHEKSREWVFAGGVFELQRGSDWSNVGNPGTAWFGGRRQEIVFIGTQKMSRERICSLLDACLLTTEEMLGGPSEWEKMRDPLVLTLSVRERAQAAQMPTSHSKACPCCDPDLKDLDQIAYGG